MMKGEQVMTDRRQQPTPRAERCDVTVQAVTCGSSTSRLIATIDNDASMIVRDPAPLASPPSAPLQTRSFSIHA